VLLWFKLSEKTKGCLRGFILNDMLMLSFFVGYCEFINGTGVSKSVAVPQDTHSQRRSREVLAGIV
jgi:hypothetical protein